ncbi:MAG: preprotein translocase subunit SecE [Candidatus Accumulibacter sp.]|jgi:preprotein translocase subunit SecE|nr:preprotein translocase subunit SecE [Accumulibacter sp.]
MADKIKFSLALLCLAAGVAAFYFLADYATVWRVLAVLAGLSVSAAIAWKTEPGRDFFVFAEESITETKKVVWPSRKETLQFTGLVFAFVIILALVLWIADKGIEWLLYDLVLGWRKS